MTITSKKCHSIVS